MSYPWEKFHRAVTTLMGAGSVQERLREAYAYHLISVHDDELPEEIRGDFDSVRRACGTPSIDREQADGKHAVENFPEELALEYTRKILEIYDFLALRDAVALKQR